MHQKCSNWVVWIKQDQNTLLIKGFRMYHEWRTSASRRQHWDKISEVVYATIKIRVLKEIFQLYIE